MGTTVPDVKKAIYQKSLHNLTLFIQALTDLSKIPEIQEACKKAPGDLVKGRSLIEIVLDDTIEAFTTILHPLPDADIPKGYYRTLVRARNPWATETNEVLDANLQKILEEKRNSPNGRDPKVPDFLTIMEEKFSPETFGHMVNGCKENWLLIIKNIATLSQSNSELLIRETLSDIEHVTAQALEEISIRPQTRLEKLLSEHAINLSTLTENTPDAYGREADIRNLERIMLQKNGPLALIHGEHGVGKSTLVEAMAAELASGKGPERLKNATIYRIPLMDMIFEMTPDRLQIILKDILSNAAESNRNTPDHPVIIDFPDYGADAPPLNQQMPVLRAIIDYAIENYPELMLICEVSSQELVELETSARDMPNEKSRTDRLQKVGVKELSVEATTKKAKELAEELGAYHNVTVSDDVVTYLVDKADKFIHGPRPAKTLGILQEAVAAAELNGDFDLSEQSVNAVIAQKTNLPLALIGGEMSERIDTLPETLLRRIFGQDEAIEAVSGHLSLVNSGMHNPNKPLGVFYLTGGTGVGKTALAKALSEILSGGDKKALITVNLADFTEKHTSSRLIGSPPGFIGYGDKTALEDVVDHPFSVILFDEAEKAHPDVDNALMKMMDEGEMTLLNGKHLDFRNSVIIFSSNLGASAVEEAKTKATIGFSNVTGEDRRKAAGEALNGAMKIRFKPEFVQRAKFVRMNDLTTPIVEKIALKQINEVSDRLRKNNKSCAGLQEITLSDDAMKELMAIGFDPRNGARPMERAIESSIQVPLGKWLKKNGQTILNKTFSLAVKEVKSGFDLEVSYPSPKILAP